MSGFHFSILRPVLRMVVSLPAIASLAFPTFFRARVLRILGLAKGYCVSLLSPWQIAPKGVFVFIAWTPELKLLVMDLACQQSQRSLRELLDL